MNKELTKPNKTKQFSYRKEIKMKKQHRIVSLMLVFTLLFSCFVFTGAVSSSAADSGSAYTATFATNAANTSAGMAAIKSDSADNKLYSIGAADLTQYTQSVVTRSDGSTYFQLTVNETADTPTANPQFHIFTAADGTGGTGVTYDANGTYAVYDFDISTETTLPNLVFIGGARGAAGWSSPDYSAWANTNIHSIVSPTPGEFVHMTLIQDFVNNVLYMYVNNELVNKAQKAFTTTDAAKEGVQGSPFYPVIKIAAYSSYTAPMTLTAGETMLLDNLTVSIYTGDEAGNLSSTIENLGAWDKNLYSSSDYEMPTIPALAEINGNEYNNVTDVNNKLGYALTTKNITLLRASYPSITVACNGVLDPNGLSTYTLASGATSTTNSDGTVSISVEAPESLTTTEVTSVVPTTSSNTSGSTLTDVSIFKYPVSDNKISKAWFQGYNVEAGKLLSTIQDTLSGRTYFSDSPYDSGTTKGYHGFYMDSSVNSYDGSEQYVVIDLDFAGSSYTDSLMFEIVSRSSDSSNNGRSSSFYVHKALTAAGVSAGTFAHITLIGDVLNNKLHAFINGTYVDISSYLSSNFYKDGATYFESFRMPQNYTGTFSYANLCLRMTTDTTAKTAITNKDLDAYEGNIYNDYYKQNYEIRGTGCTIAQVGEECCFTAADIENVLSDGQKRIIGLATDVTDTVTFTCPAIIQTNGHTISYATANGCTSRVDDANGLIIISSADAADEVIPAYTSNKTSVNVGNTITGLAYSGSDNKFSQVYFNNWNAAGYLTLEKVTDTITGKYYFTQTPYNDDGTVNSSSYERYYMGNNNYTSGEGQHLIIEMDLAIEDLSVDLNVSLTTGQGGGIWNAGRRTNWLKLDDVFLTAGISENEFAHLTVIGDIDENKIYIYVNGQKIDPTNCTQSNTTLTSGLFYEPTYSKTANDYDITSENITSYGFSAWEWMDSSKYSTCFSTANVYMNYYNTTVNLDNISNLDDFDGDIYTADYKANYEVRGISKATVDGDIYYTLDEIHAAIANGTSIKDVVILHQLDAPITVSGNAVVDAHGWANCAIADEDTELLAEKAGKLYFAKDSTDKIEPDYSVEEFDTMSTVKFAGTAIDGNGINLGEANPGSFKYYGIVESDGNVFYMLQPAEEKASQNTFINFEMNDLNLSSGTGYSVTEFDVATETEVIDQLIVTHIIRYTDPDTKVRCDADTPRDSYIYLKDYIEPSAEWARFSIVGDFANNKMHIFVNGKLVDSVDNIYSQTAIDTYNTTNNTSVTINDCALQSVRIQVPKYSTLNMTHTTMVDNFFTRAYTSDTANLEECIASGSLDAYTERVTGNIGKSLPSHILIDGVGYNYLAKDAIEEALGDGKDHAVYVVGSPITHGLTETYTVASNTGISTNGYTNCFTPEISHTMTVGDGVTMIQYTDELARATVKINGITIYSDVVPYGTDLKAILEEQGTYFGDAGSSVAVGNGYVFKNVTWDYEPGDVVSNITFSGTGTQVTTPYFVHLNGVEKTNYDLTAANFYQYIGNSSLAGISVILNSNISTAVGQSVNAEKAVYLNGYTLTYTGGGQGMNLSSTADITFAGPGNILNMEANNTNGFIYCGQGNANASITLKNLSVQTNQSFSKMRDGDLVIDNCDINVFIAMQWGNPVFDMGEKSTAPMHILIKDSTIKSSTYDERTGFFHEMCNGSAHVVDVINSTIIAQNHLFSGQIYTADSTKASSSTTYNFTDSVIIAKYVLNTSLSGSNYSTKESLSGTYTPTINFIDNVSVNEAFASSSTFGYINIADGLKLAKNNNYMAPITYTTDYAEVYLSNCSIERWVSGSTPVLANNMTQVTEVYKGGDYTFTTVASSVPFTLLANLSLGSELKFNLYTPKDEGELVSIKVGGVSYHPTVVRMTNNGTEALYNCYSIVLSPEEAAVSFDVLFECADGYSIAKTLSVAQYASLVYNLEDTAAHALMSTTLEYIKATTNFAGYNIDMTDVEAQLSAHAASITDVNSLESTANTSNISTYITTASLDLGDHMNFRFKLADGFDASRVTIMVSNTETEFDVENGYIVLDLHAYDMTSMITFSISNGDSDAITGTYDLLAYCKATIASAATGAHGMGLIYYNFATKHNLANIIYSYAAAAAAYAG